MVFSNKNASKPDLRISIDGHAIDETDHTKFLGVIIDSKLNWKNHISYITGKLLEALVLLQRLESCSIKKHWSPYITHLFIRTCVIVIMCGVTLMWQI